DEVIRIGLEFEAILLINRECLPQVEIPVLESRLIDGVANTLLVNEGAGRGRRKDRCAIPIRSCEPLVGFLTRVSGELFQQLWMPVHGVELALAAAAKASDLANAGQVIACSDSARGAALELSVPAQLPAAEKLTGKRVLVPEERQCVLVVDHEYVAGIVLRRTPQPGQVIGIGHDVAIVGAVVRAL